jgi:DNA replication protein DnaC
MQNDTETMVDEEIYERRRADELALAKLMRFAKSTSCIYCGENAPDGVCDDCDRTAEAKNVALGERLALGALEAKKRAFREKVGNYCDNQPELLPDTAAIRAVPQFVVGGRCGLTLIGPGSTGKTRAACMVAEKEMAAGNWVEFRQCGDLRQEVIGFARKGEQAQGVRPLLKCDLLILDDFGNHEFTRTTEEFFLSLLERRTNTGKRTVVTTQYQPAQLKALFTTPQMADAILRRVGKQFALVANTGDNTITLPFR